MQKQPTDAAKSAEGQDFVFSALLADQHHGHFIGLLISSTYDNSRNSYDPQRSGGTDSCGVSRGAGNLLDFQRTGNTIRFLGNVDSITHYLWPNSALAKSAKRLEKL
jgi:hypothetical protein